MSGIIVSDTSRYAEARGQSEPLCRFDEGS